MDGLSGRPGNGPATPSSYSGPYLTSTLFKVTQDNLWIEGFWWWVCPSGQSTAAQVFALWQYVNGGATYTGITATSGTLTAGAWNYIPLAAKYPLSKNISYGATTGFNNSFPETDSQYGGSPGPYSAGITNGPLFAYSDKAANGGTAPPPFSYGQSLFGTFGNNPLTATAGSGFNSANFWMDVQVSDVGVPGTSYRLWPNMPTPPTTQLDTAGNFTLGTEFWLSQPCKLNKIWFYSPPGVTQLPTECGIWSVATQTLIPGTDNASPAWSGAAGSGWISCPYSGITLPGGGAKYKVTVLNGAGTAAVWNAASVAYWNTATSGGNGITAGPLSAPNLANATSPGQDTYNNGILFTYPLTYDNVGTGDNYWVDVEVTPVASGSGLLMASFP
jgi:hypothetical protein